MFILGVSGGRSGYVSLLLVAPLLIYKATGHFHLKKILFAVMLVIILLFSFGTVRDRFAEIGNDIQAYYAGNPNSSIGLRLHMWDSSLKIMAQHPFLGIGTGSYQMMMEQYERVNQEAVVHKINNPHNNLLYMAVNFGFLGLAIVLWLFYALIKKGWQAKDTRAGFAVLAYGVIVIMVGLTSTTIIDFATANMMSLMFGIRTPEE